MKNRILAGDPSTAFPYMYIKGSEDPKSALLGFITVIDTVNVGGLHQEDG